MNTSAKSVSIAIPSNISSVLFLTIYLFAVIPFAYGIVYVADLAGLPSGLVKPNLPDCMLFFQAMLTAYMIYHLLRDYRDYLLSYNWKPSFDRYLLVGINWSIPLLVIQLVTLATPVFRDKLIGDYLSMRIISVKGATNTSLLIFSVWVLFGAVLEELIFGGIFLQKLSHVLNRTLSVFIIAGLFAFSHFSLSGIQVSIFTDAFLVGILSGFAFIKTSSCISASLPHLISNAFCIGIILAIRQNGLSAG